MEELELKTEKCLTENEDNKGNRRNQFFKYDAARPAARHTWTKTQGVQKSIEAKGPRGRVKY